MIPTYPNLAVKMAERGITVSDLAKLLNLPYIATYRRVHGKTEWKVAEAAKLCDIFDCFDIQFLLLRLDSN